MPLVAQDDTGIRYETINNLDFINKYNGGWCCPYCKGEMVFVDGKVVIKHFRHKVTCPYETEPESERHLAMKAYMKELFPSAELEVRIGNRINDVMFNDVAIECQASPIRPDEILARNEDYKKMGKVPFWVLGTRESNELNDEWIRFDHSTHAVYWDMMNTVLVRDYERLLASLYDVNYFFRDDLAHNTIGRYSFHIFRNRIKKGVYIKTNFCSEGKFKLWNGLLILR